jgi:D-glycero-alpha-D-manno-heptose 1-phosphate guanylyltransferase
MAEQSLPPIIVLCGGLGTRLRSVVPDRPKVLADVAGRPFLSYLLRHLLAQGAPDIVLSGGYRAEQITAYLENERDLDAHVRLIVESQPLGTGGAIRFAAEAAATPGTLIALNGDTFFGGSLQDLTRAHQASHARLTMALAYAANVERYGSVAIDPTTGGVLAFTEKGSRGCGWINAGAYVIEPEVLSEIPLERPMSLEREVLPRLIGRGLHAVAFEGVPFLDIGVPDDLARARQVFAPSILS